MKLSFVTQVRMHGLIKGMYICIKELYFSMLTVVSPTLNTKARYKMEYKKKLNLQKPQTLSEKLLWLKLNRYMNDPMVIQCADKYRVREYIKSCGCEDILNRLIGVWDSAKEIPWEKLPNQFVLKWNFGAGMNIICVDKTKMDEKQIVHQLEKWGRVKCWLSHSEMQYKYIPKKIVCEEYLQDSQHDNALPDYKVYCFHGEPLVTLVMLDRGSEIKAEFFDCDWNVLENSKYKKPEVDVEKPACYQQMLDDARLLSKPFPFVRVDFYVVNGKLFFGELTFTPAGGLYMSQTKIQGKDMTEYLHVG